MKQDYSIFYKNITDHFSEREKAMICVFNKITTYLFYIGYPVLLGYIFLKQRDSFSRILCIPAVSFLLLSAVRRKINRKRPYESFAIDPVIHKDTKGNSMPSRHIFSASIISMCFLYVNPYAGIFMFIMTILACITRVIGGVHYPTDVLAGLAAGILCGIFIFL